MHRFSRRFRKIARSLSSVELMQSSLDELFELEDYLWDPANRRRFLDFYGDIGIRTALERYGLLGVLEGLGYGSIEIATHANEEQHTLIVTGDGNGRTKEHLVELTVRRDQFVPAPRLRPPLRDHYDVLTIDWLSLRHPAGSFTTQRPRLPGQDAPGLGEGMRVAAMLEQVAKRLDLHALVTTAEHFHNAVFYQRAMRYFDPKHRAIYEALERLLLHDAKLSLAQASWAIAWGLVRLNGEPFEWKGETQLLSLDAGLTLYLESRAHNDATKSAGAELHFELDRRTLDTRWERQLPTLCHTVGENRSPGER